MVVVPGALKNFQKYNIADNYIQRVDILVQLPRCGDQHFIQPVDPY